MEMPPFDQLTLRTPRLVLRPLAPLDAPVLLAIFSDPTVMRYWSTPPWTSIDTAHAVIAQDRSEMAEGAYIRLGIEETATSRLVGTCSLFNMMPICRRAEIGYALAAEAWGRGLMHEALRGLLGYAFATLDLNRIEADIDPRNQASAKTLERLGFTREGYLRERWIVDGVISDTALYGLLQREWQEQ
ncbi:MAG: GNAT family N-acetyltransferase [Caldilineaceae bacterium]|nr:GNAT family N-acetyltransferase [Caldilineaceae bacterium]